MPADALAPYITRPSENMIFNMKTVQIFFVEEFHCFVSYQISGNDVKLHIDEFLLERHNSSALAMELRLSCINPSIWNTKTGHDIQTWQIFSKTLKIDTP